MDKKKLVGIFAIVAGVFVIIVQVFSGGERNLQVLGMGFVIIVIGAYVISIKKISTKK